MSTAGARTLEAAAKIGLGTSILCLSQTDAVVVNGFYINDGEWVEFVVVNNASNAHEWAVKSSSTASAGTVDMQLPVSGWRIHDAPESVLLTGAGITDDMGVNAGTYGTSVQSLNSLDAGGAGETFYARQQVVVPANYLQGDVLKVICTVNEVVACATSATLDVECYRVDVPATDLCATSAQSIIGASDTDYDFTLTSTAIKPIDKVRLTTKSS
jgi:hypothetical protein